MVNRNMVNKPTSDIILLFSSPQCTNILFCEYKTVYEEMKFSTQTNKMKDETFEGKCIVKCGGKSENCNIL